MTDLRWRAQAALREPEHCVDWSWAPRWRYAALIWAAMVVLWWLL